MVWAQPRCGKSSWGLACWGGWHPAPRQQVRDGVGCPWGGVPPGRRPHVPLWVLHQLLDPRRPGLQGRGLTLLSVGSWLRPCWGLCSRGLALPRSFSISSAPRTGPPRQSCLELTCQLRVHPPGARASEGCWQGEVLERWVHLVTSKQLDLGQVMTNCSMPQFRLLNPRIIPPPGCVEAPRRVKLLQTAEPYVCLQGPVSPCSCETWPRAPVAWSPTPGLPRAGHLAGRGEQPFALLVVTFESAMRGRHGAAVPPADASRHRSPKCRRPTVGGWGMGGSGGGVEVGEAVGPAGLIKQEQNFPETQTQSLNGTPLPVQTSAKGKQQVAG